jgi:hypothetical protein
MRGGCELASGDVLLPLSDIPNYATVFVVRSNDGGLNWGSPRLAARREGSQFEEPSLVELENGRLLMVLRDNGTRYLHTVSSGDGGLTWSEPRRLPNAGYPAQLLKLPDHRILMTYGWRFPRFGIRAVISKDGGETWATDETIIVRDDLPSKNLGYPATVTGPDGSLFTVYYGEDTDGATVIMGTWWRLP